jgi:DNA-directed RNA polymerase specialized sigma24 family protein
MNAEQFLEMGQRMALAMAPKGKEDGYVSAAYYGIVWALLNAEGKSDKETWVRSCIFRQLHKHRMSDHLISIPAETRRLAKKRGEQLRQLIQQDSEALQNITVEPSNEAEIMDLLLKSANGPDDQAIISMRIEGYKDPEIAQTLSKSPAYIQKRRISIKIRFDTLRDS